MVPHLAPVLRWLPTPACNRMSLRQQAKGSRRGSQVHGMQEVQHTQHCSPCMLSFACIWTVDGLPSDCDSQHALLQRS